MTTVADLVTAFHDIDALKGRVCGGCTSYYSHPAGRRNCQKGYGPSGPDDGCDDWQPKHNPDRANMAVVMSV